ncbi:methylated-DNA--[protein]-cysteine S-methyltransferase [Pseudothermotoga sp.]|uniref:methylated-DNA--[protein]-cysteine S-methyltransferase n=1 Tax=Pseudothermotoga sp. TaxID=2033661 RepID=UPI002588840B|nr:methylated-DNA--[protein]-cysteine S-methyltransferase [Pseudothermotoga sp.]MDK2885176.1 methylated-DNA-[protein]-cysteine S-methyltransferase [Pseudothermotoga sp.]
MDCGFVSTKIGFVSVYVERGAVTRIEFAKKCEGKVSSEILKQLEQYFEGKRKTLDFPVRFSGTEFQKKVWNELRKIPYGKTVSYGELARKLDTSPRAIGQALKANPLPVYFPCHRVVAKGSIGGFSGGLEWKKMLLELERCNL